MGRETGNRYRRLDESQILATLTRLRDRIGERFPESGLSRVAAELLAIGHETAARSAYLQAANRPIRVAVGIVIAVIALILVAVVTSLPAPAGLGGVLTLLQATESAINDLLFLAAGVFFLITLESRLKRRTALAALHQLRSVAHIIDMHQLTKDPERLLSAEANTASSPTRDLRAPELGRYLDYCSELLSLTSKIAALHVQFFNDPVVLAAVNEIEGLTTALSGKIWQKITLLDPHS